jgi:hypothetical protein
MTGELCIISLIEEEEEIQHSEDKTHPHWLLVTYMPVLKGISDHQRLHTTYKM